MPARPLPAAAARTLPCLPPSMAVMWYMGLLCWDSWQRGWLNACMLKACSSSSQIQEETMGSVMVSGDPRERHPDDVAVEPSALCLAGGVQASCSVNTRQRAWRYGQRVAIQSVHQAQALSSDRMGCHVLGLVLGQHPLCQLAVAAAVLKGLVLLPKGLEGRCRHHHCSLVHRSAGSMLHLHPRAGGACDAELSRVI